MISIGVPRDLRWSFRRSRNEKNAHQNSKRNHRAHNCDAFLEYFGKSVNVDVNADGCNIKTGIINGKLVA